MRLVEALDELARAGGPLRQHRRITPVTTRLVGQLPREDGRRGFVAVDKNLDVVAVDGLAGSVGEPLGGIGAECGGVGGDAAVVAPVVDKVENQFDAVLLGTVDGVVEALEAVGAKIDVAACGIEDLEVDFIGVCVGAWVWRVDIAEAPDTKNLVLGLDACQ